MTQNRPSDSELLEIAKRLAPKASNWAALGKLVARETDQEISESTWRGIRKHNYPEALIIDGLTNPNAPSTISRIERVTVTEQRPSFDKVLEKATRDYEKSRDISQRKKSQRIEFTNGPIGIAFIADTHLGARGVDYARVFEDVDLMCRTPNLYVVAVGDITDNTITQKLLSVRMGASLTVPEEWALSEEFYKRLACPKAQMMRDTDINDSMDPEQGSLLAVVGGNHEYWTTIASGIDMVSEQVSRVARDCMYDPDEVYMRVVVDGFDCPIRARHKWRYSSMLNPTHGMERSYERDQSKDFLVGVGAHTHVSCLIREFNAGGRTGVGIQCGTYKVLDSYGRRLGVNDANHSTTPMVIIDPEYGQPLGYSNLRAGIASLRGFRR